MSGSDFDHFKIFLASSTLGADPVLGYVLPARAGFNAFLGQTGLFVIDKATHHTDKFFKIFHHYLTGNALFHTHRIPGWVF